MEFIKTDKPNTAKLYPKPGAKYKHYKGGTYEVLSLAKHTETDEDMVVYSSTLFGTVYVRPLALWYQLVNAVENGYETKTRRFTILQNG
jgi:hypothetical protein